MKLTAKTEVDRECFGLLLICFIGLLGVAIALLSEAPVWWLDFKNLADIEVGTTEASYHQGR